MVQNTTTQCSLFEGLEKRPVQAVFDEPCSSSDGGAVLLSAADRRLGLLSDLAQCVSDGRDATRVRHEVEELLRERVFAIACGYEDANDASRLADDPVFKLIVGRDPANGARLASQPTLSRFERAVSSKDLMRMGQALTRNVIRRRRRRRKKAARITIDFDLTHDETHGQQPLAFFNGFYRTWCYLPLLGFIRFDGDPEHYLVAALLRAGNAPATQGLLPVLRRLVEELKQEYPKARLRLRLDAGFPSPELLDYAESENLEYVIGLAKNSRLEDLTCDLMERVRARAEKSGQSERVYEVCRYGAHTWSRLRRVVVKAEVTVFPGRALRDNLRFVVTNLEHRSAQQVWEQDYCARGEIENRIKELKDGLHIDRTSSSSFLANQFRVLMTAAAYAILQEIRFHAAKTRFARAQVTTLRDHLLKLGARVVASVRRIVLHFPASCPAQSDWRRLAAALGARPG
jgi:hypothetical protein